jgi:hypothetical protein
VNGDKLGKLVGAPRAPLAALSWLKTIAIEVICPMADLSAVLSLRAAPSAFSSIGISSTERVFINRDPSDNDREG